MDSFFNINNDNDVDQNNKKDQTLVNTYLSNIRKSTNIKFFNKWDQKNLS